VKEKFHINAYFIVSLNYYWCDTYWHLRHTYRPVSKRNSKMLKIKNKNRNLLINKWKLHTYSVVACVASVSVEFGAKKEWDFRCFSCAKNGVHSHMKGQAAGFQNPGVCLQAFPSFPFSSLSFPFLALAPFFENPVPLTFFAPQPHGNACYTG